KSILSGRGVTAVLGGCLFAILAGSFDPVVAQAPADILSRIQSLPPTQQSLPLRRYQYFYQQRAYPEQQIPSGAYQQARRQHEQQFGPIRQSPAPGPAPPPFNQNQWTPIGPSHIATNPITSGRTNTMRSIRPTRMSSMSAPRPAGCGRRRTAAPPGPR